MKINILLCDTFPGLLPAYIPSYVSMFTRLFSGVDPATTYEVYNAMDGELPGELHQGELYLITGCNHGAYDPTPWIRQLARWVVGACETGVKLVGVCFGHQLIAQALGGRVEKAAVGWGVGVRQTRVTDAEARHYFPDGTMSLFYNHHDQVVELPACATPVATSAFCPVESFRVGNSVLCFQGHPEYVPEYEVHLLMRFADGEPQEVCRAALDSIGETVHQGRRVAQWILEWCKQR